MNNLDEKIKKALKQEIELPENFQNSVRETLENCTQNSTINKANNKHRVLNIVKKIIATIVVGASTITVYATTARKIPFEEMGLSKAGENYEESSVAINKTIENDYASITLESMAGDGAYIIAEYKINLKEKAINEYGNITYNEVMGYNLWLANNVFVNSNKVTKGTSSVIKVTDNEFICMQVINVMDIKEKDLNIKIYIDNISINSNHVAINKIIQTNAKFKNDAKNKFVAQEQILDEKNKIVINSVGNTKFETYITAQKIIENMTYKEYEELDPCTYNSFIVTDENGEKIPYKINYRNSIEDKFYRKNEKGEMELINRDSLKDDDIIKHVENFVILIGSQANVKSVKVIPIETSFFNDRTGEEEREYKKVKWYPLVEGEKKYSAKSSLGGTFEIEKIEINEDDITFHYNEEGLIGRETLVIMRKKNEDMNYIHPVIRSKTEDKIVFSKDVTMAAGLNTYKVHDMFDNIENVEFALLFGSRSKFVADIFTVEIPTQNNNIAEFSKVEVSDAKIMKLECTIKYGKKCDYTIYYDENNKILSFDDNSFPLWKINEDYYDDAMELAEAIEEFCVEKGGSCNRIIE